jgi:catabolite regulation protein CreA
MVVGSVERHDFPGKADIVIGNNLTDPSVTG